MLNSRSQLQIISMLFSAFLAVMVGSVMKQCYEQIVVINCQPQPQQVICKVFGGPNLAETQALEIPKTQLSRVETIEGRMHNNQRTEQKILTTIDQQQISLGNFFNEIG